MKLHAAGRIVVMALGLLIAFVAGQFSTRSVAEQVREHWEYQIVGSYHTAEKLNE